MSKTAVVSLVIVVVLVIGGYFIFKNRGANYAPVANNVITPGQEQTTTPAGGKMSFTDFLKGGAYKCEITQNVNGSATSGTTYIDNGLIRADFSTKVQGMTINSNIIVRDGYTYSWSSAYPGGFKIKTDTTNTSTPGTSTPSSYSFNTAQIGDYHCDNWVSDPSKFTVPTNITFKDMGTN